MALTFFGDFFGDIFLDKYVGRFIGCFLSNFCDMPQHFVTTAHCKTLLYRPLYKFAASGGKLRPWLAKNLLCLLAWIQNLLCLLAWIHSGLIITLCLDQSGKLAGHSRK